MPTIGSLIIEVAGDNTKLRRTFRDSEQLQTAYAAGIKRSQTTFAQNAAITRESLFTGALSPAAFAKQGTAAAKAWNEKVLSQINELRAGGALTPKLHTMLVDELRDAGLEAGKSFVASMGSSLTSAGKTLRGVGAKMTAGITLPVAAEGALAFKAASDAAEEANAFRVTFGPLADEVQRKLDQLHQTIPVTNTQLRNLAGNFGALLLPMGIAPQKAAAMSTKLVELAGDIQSLRNIPFAEVVQRLTSGLVGETEAVRRLGANIGEVALKAESMRLGFGKNITALTSAQKAQAVYNILLRDTKLATGDAANTMDSAANSVRFAQRNFQELQVVIGNQLIPVITPLIRSFAGWLEQLQKVNPETILFVAKLSVFAALAGPVITALGGIAGALGLVLRGVLAIRAAGGIMAALGGGAAAAGAAGGAAGGAAAGGGAVAGVRGLTAALGAGGLVAALAAVSVGLIVWVDQMNSAEHKLGTLGEAAKKMSRDQLAAEITARSARIGELQRQAANAPLVASDVTAGRATGPMSATESQGPRESRATIETRIKAESDGLRVLTQQWNEMGAAETKANDIAARQMAVWREMMAESAKAAAGAAAPDPGKAAAALEATLNQVLQTKAALKGAGESAGFLNAEIAQIIKDATNAETEHNAVLVRQGKLYDNISVRLTEIRAKAEEALFGGLKVPAMNMIGQTTPKPMTPELAAQRLGFGTNTVFANANLGGQITPAQLPKSAPLSKFEIQVIKLNDSLERGAAAVGKFGLSLVKGLGEALNPLRLIGQVFQQFASAFVPVLDPLAAVFAKLASVVAQDLAPLFKALEPVLAALIPVVDAILRVVTPILTALVPILNAFVPILKALFPILKAGAIVATYLFQAFALGASIFLRAIGNIVIGWGAILKALATAIDKLPFVNARGAINAAQGVIDFGNSLLNASDEFKKSADEMGKAREEIKKVNFDDTTSDVKKLGEAASETADALRGVPAWWKSQLAIWEATHARDGVAPPPGSGSAAGGRPGTESLRGPVLVPPPVTPAPIILPPIGAGGGGAGGFTGAAGDTGARLALRIDNITIAEPVKTGRELLDELVAEAKKYAQATFGTTSRWYEVL